MPLGCCPCAVYAVRIDHAGERRNRIWVSSPWRGAGPSFRESDSAVQYVYNLNLVEDSADQVNTWGLELAPGFYASYLSGSVTAALDYSLIGRVWGESDYNDVSQIGAANGRWTAVPELFFVDAQGSITQNPINASAGIDYGQIGIFGQDNLSQQATASIAPSLQRQLGRVRFLCAVLRTAASGTSIRAVRRTG